MAQDEAVPNGDQPVETPQSAAWIGNYITIFTMVVLQEILLDLRNNPVTNFNRIIAVATAIAGLNASIKPIQ